MKLLAIPQGWAWEPWEFEDNGGGKLVTSEAKEVSRDQSMVYLLVLYSNTGAEDLLKVLDKERCGLMC